MLRLPWLLILDVLWLKDLADRVKDWLPQAQFEPMIRMLKKFLGFMNFTVR